MNIKIDGGRDFEVKSFGSDPSIASMTVRIRGTKENLRLIDVSEQEVNGIRHGLFKAFEKLQNGEATINRKFEAEFSSEGKEPATVSPDKTIH